MKRILGLGLMLMMAAVVGVSAQCPTAKVIGPSSDMKVGDHVQFSVMITGGDPKVTPKIEWSVSTGKITKGQGDVVIDVDSTGMFQNTITATAEIKGYGDSCYVTGNTSAFFAPKGPEARKVDSFGMLEPADEKARLDAFVTELMSDPMANVYIIAYNAPKGDTKGTAAMKRAVDYLTNTRGIDATRIFTGDGGTRKLAAIELFIAPYGATPPKASPDDLE